MEDRRSESRPLRDLMIQTIALLTVELYRPPTPEEVSERMAVGRQTLQYHADILARAGVIRKLYGGRAWQVVPSGLRGNGEGEASVSG